MMSLNLTENGEPVWGNKNNNNNNNPENALQHSNTATQLGKQINNAKKLFYFIQFTTCNLLYNFTDIYRQK